MKPNQLALLIGGMGLFWWQTFGGSALAGLAMLLVMAAAFAGLYSATGFRAHRFALLSLALGGVALVVGQAVML